MPKLIQNLKVFLKRPFSRLNIHPNWPKVSIYTNITIAVVALIALSGGIVIHQSNTNPQFCGLCHVMQPNVQSYLNGPNLDNLHEQAGVACKDCHDYPLPAEITSGVKFLIGDYTVDASGSLVQRKYDDEMCTKCHISAQHVAEETDFLYRNPHDSHNGSLACSTCHISHGQQIDFCSSCHDNGGQRMVGEPITLRGTIGGQ